MQMFAFTIFNHWRQQHQLSALGQCQYLIHHLTDGLGIERLTMFRTARFTSTGKQQAQIIVYFGNRAYGRARIMRGRLLFNRNSRRQPFNVVDIGFFHH